MYVRMYMLRAVLVDCLLLIVNIFLTVLDTRDNIQSIISRVDRL